jgi:MFS transporter, AAHS family, 4-hydroxybenzoate transporter
MTNSSTFFDDSKVSKLQLTTIFICFLMNILDGMDVMVVSYATTAITQSWAITPQALGAVFSAGLVGMTVGSMFIAPRADVVGRRNIILLSAVLMGSLVLLSSFVQSITQLVILRFLSGLGIGSMLASCATLASEYAPVKSKDFWISLVMSGYPIGAVLSGLAAAQIIPAFGWQAMFQTAGVVTLLAVPIIYFYLAESLDFLLKSQPTNALAKANALLKQLNQPILTALPPLSIETSEKAKTALFANSTSKKPVLYLLDVLKVATSSLLSGSRKKPTIYLWLALFMAFGSMYFLVTWIPNLAKATGLSVKLAIYAGTVFNLGAFVGIVTQGYLSSQFGLRRTLFSFLLGTAIFMMIFGFFTGSFMVLVMFGLIGFGIQGGFVGLYAVAARLYPTEIRSTGVGWAMSAGRIGGIVGPILGGFLVGGGMTISTTFIIFAVPTLLAGIFTLWISSKGIS